ncbi:MAG: leucine-rich repeat protein [Clostridia bacterium]|nr:leucine-rich repeat protein [Clostridia bacterium]
MLKRIFALILTVLMLAVSIPVQAIAAEIGEWIPSPELPTSSGEVGLIDPVQVEVVDDLIVDHDNSDPALDYADLTPDQTGVTGECTWALYGTELVISGNGKMGDYNDTDNPAPWGNRITKVTIGSGVTNIGNSAFSSCGSLTSVTIPETVKTVGSFAFEYASALKSASLPEGVEEIGLQAFHNCTNLSSVSLPDSLTLVGEEAFLGCNLTYTYYYDGNFHGKYLGNPSNPYVLMYSVAPNGNNYSYKLTSFTVHPNTRVIGPTAFYEKTDLKSITLSESLQGISDYAFYGCYSLADLTLPESVSHIGAGAFYNCTVDSGIFTDALTYIGDGAFYACYNIAGDIVFPDKLEYIGSQAFFGCYNITSITMPDSVKYVDFWAFYECEALESVTVSDNLTYLGEEAFYGCDNLKYYTYGNASYLSSKSNKCYVLVKPNSRTITSFSVPANTKIVMGYAFDGCNQLTTVTVPNSVVYVGIAAFANCSALQSLTVPYVEYLALFFGTNSGSGLYGIECDDRGGTFYLPESLKTLTVNGGKIRKRAFSSCNSLTTVTLPNGITEIGEAAFYNCSGLKSINLPESLEYLGDYAFYNCALTNVALAGSIKSIGARCFQECRKLAKVSIGGSVTDIGECAFIGCVALQTLEIAEGVKTIGESAFYGCYSLKSAVVPKSVETMGYYTFSNCFALEDLTVPFVGASRCTALEDEDCTLAYVIAGYNTSDYALKKVTVTDSGGLLANNAFAEWASIEEVVLEEGLREIGSCAFEDCISLTSISIPSSITDIKTNAFYGCESLEYNTDGAARYLGNSSNPYVILVAITSTDITSFEFKAQSKCMAANAFSECTELKSIVIPDGFTRIPSGAFSYCYKLSSVTLPDSIVEIADYAFYFCEALTDFNIPPYVNSIGIEAFTGCSSITSIEIPEGVTVINDSAFQACISLTEVKLPNTLELIYPIAFLSCTSLTEITIPDNVKQIGYEAFENCEKLSSIHLPENLEYLGDGAFKYCTSLTSIEIPNGIEEIKFDTFYECTALTEIDLPDSLKTIGKNAFYGCNALEEIIIPKSVTSIGESILYGCGSLRSLTIPFVGSKRTASTETNQYPLGYIFGTSSYTGGVSTKQYYYGSSLTSTTSSTYYIPTSLKTVTVTGGDLNYGAFYNCNNIETIVIGDGVESITPDAFIGTTALKSIEVSENNPNYCSVSGVLYNKNKTEIIWIPENLTLTLTVNYLYATGETAFSSVTKTVKYNTAYSVEVPEIVGYTPNYTEISGTMPAYDLTIDVIYYEHELIARGDCNSDISWTLYTDGTLVLRGSGEMPDYTSGSSPWAAYADKVQTVYIDSAITHIGAYSFENCVNLTYIDYGYGVKSIGDYAFKNCDSLDSFSIPATVTEISDGAFCDCDGLTSVVIPDNVTKIGKNAFNGCDSLIQATVGGAVTEIGIDAFAGCASLTQVYFRGAPAVLGSNAFGSTDGKFVYYYSSVSGWDDVITDGTWNGYTAIPFNAISDERFNGTNVYIIKVVDKHNTPLVGAVVTLNGKVQATNDDGMAYFVKPDTAVTLTVECSDHIDFIDTSFSATTTQIMDIIELSDKPSFVQGVRVNGKSVATSVVTINAADNKTVSITVSGYSKYTIVKYELYQGNRLIATNKTDASETTFNVSSGAFEEGETVVVRMHASDGSIATAALNIDVVKLAKIDENQVLTELSDISMNIEMDSLGSFNFALPFSVNGAPNLSVYTEGRSIYVGINMDPKDVVLKGLSKSEIVKKIDKTIKSTESYDKGVEVSICGYLEIEYLGNGEYYVKSNYVKMRVEVMFESQIQATFYGIVGLYVKVGIGAAGELELKIERFEPEEGFSLKQADITLETIMDLEGGVYLLWGAGTAGFYGTLKIRFTIGMVPVTQWKQIVGTGDFGVRWSVLWGMVKGEYSAVSGEFFRWEPDSAKALMAELQRALSDPSSYTQNDRSYLDTRSDWLSGTDGDLQTSIYGEVAPEIVQCGDTTMMVWLDDNADRHLDNYQTLYYSICNDGIWSAPTPVDNNDTFDCEFDVYTDGNAIYIVYTEMVSRVADMQSIDISDAEALKALVGNVELSVVVYENGAFSEPVRITDNSICEQLPTIGVSDGYLTVAWLESDSVGIDNTLYENSIAVSYLDVVGWTKPETLISGNNTVSDIVVLTLDGIEYLAYIVDADGSGETIDDKVLVLRDENGDSVQLDNGSVASVELSRVAGCDALTWYNGNRLYMLESPDSEPISLLPESIVGSYDYRIVEIDDESSLLLFTDNIEAEGSDIFGMYIGVSGALTSPVRMTETDGYIASYAVYNANGDYFVVYNRTLATVNENNVETVSSLEIASLDFGCDVKLDSLDYSITDARPNASLDIELTVSNVGTEAVDGVTVNLLDSDGNLEFTFDAEICLTSGESGVIALALLLPSEISTEGYFVEILPLRGMSRVVDSDTENNKIAIDFAYADMSIAAEQKIIGERNYILFSVTNNGNTASAATLEVYAEGRLIADMRTDAISPAATKQYLIDINALTSADDKLITCTVRSDFKDALALNDQATVCLLHIDNDSLAVSPDDAAINPELSQSVIEFDKYTSSDKTVDILTEADSFVGIEGLTVNVDYTVNYDVVTLKSDYLKSLEVGSHTISFVFEQQNGSQVKRSLTLAITDSTPITVTGSIAIVGDAFVGETLRADVSKLVPNDVKPNFRWTVDGVTVSTDDSYTATLADNGKTLVLTVVAGEGYVGSFESSTVITLKKGNIPSAPVVSKVDSSSVTLVLVSGVEYSLDGLTWQTANIFTGLAPNTVYTVYARAAATETTLESDATVGVTVTTLKLTAASPSAPELESKTADTIVLKAISGAEYMIEGGEWTDSNVFTNLAPATEYRFYQRMKETDTAYASEKSVATFVTAPISVTGITADETLSLKTGETKQLNWSIEPENATNQAVYFLSTDPEIAYANEYGEVIGLKKGSVKIKITTEDGSFFALCDVTVECSHSSITQVPEAESDCTNAGWDAYATCSACGQLLSPDGMTELETIPYRELNDTHVGETETINACEPDHKAQIDGYSGDIKCISCGEIIEYGETVAVTPHTEKDAWTCDGEKHWKECSICDCIIDSTVESHTEGDWVELEDGSKELRCSDCDCLLDTKEPEKPDGILGDVNNDGEINQYDYILIKRHYFETRLLTEDESARADVNKDGTVNQFDYILVARHYFGTFVIV